MRNNRLKIGFVVAVDVQGGEDGEEQVTKLLNSRVAKIVENLFGASKITIKYNSGNGNNEEFEEWLNMVNQEILGCWD